MVRTQLTIGLVALLVLSACGDDVEDTGATAAPTTTTTTPPQNSTTTTTTTPSTTTTEVPMNSQPSDSGVEIAVSDLADRLGVDASIIEAVSVDEVTWRDGSLGCPEPGRAYTQALANGVRIVLRADGMTYEYHSGKARAPFYCPPGQGQAPSAGGDPDG